MRYRVVVAGLGCGVVALGLITRIGWSGIPFGVHDYVGDVLWAVLFYLIVRWIAPGRSLFASTGIALVIVLAIEVSQLYHLPWMDDLRRTLVGRWTLGNVFLWSDVVCCCIGVVIGLVCESAAQSWSRKADSGGR